jgi:AraC-like DNA-binding protein
MTDDDIWLSHLKQLIDKRLDDPHLDNLTLAQSLFISERQLARRVNELTGLPPQKFVRCYRLQKAQQWLHDGTYQTVKSVAAAVSYRNISFFITQFEAKFGVRPFQVLKQAGWR